MDDDPFLGLGPEAGGTGRSGCPRSVFRVSLRAPLGLYILSTLHLAELAAHLWKQVHGHLCVFANGSGDLTLLMPPIGDTGGDAVLAESVELMDQYNIAHQVPHRTRVEYASEELLARFDRSKLLVEPMGADYVYDVQRMIDLAGGDLASKRQAKNRFLRLYEHRAEPYRAANHLADCEALLDEWKIHQDAQHLEDPGINCVKRDKESIATSLCLRHAEELNLRGLVIYAREAGSSAPLSLRGFTFGEALGANQSSITIEKTHLETKGLAQFIFSEFCRDAWSDRPLVNVGDDWGLPTLAWTKMSYRPVQLLQKFVLRPANRAVLSPGLNIDVPAPAARIPPKPKTRRIPREPATRR